MDWRERNYFIVSFDYRSVLYRTSILKLIPSVKLHCPTKNISQNGSSAFPDEDCVRGNRYQYLVSCKIEDADDVIYEFEKAERNDGWCSWREIHKR